jgi:membrane protease subunit HflC
MTRTRLLLLSLFALLLALVGAQGFCVVGPDQQGLLLRWGEVVTTFGPGLHMKIPFSDSLVTYPTYVLQYDSDPVDTVTSDKKNLVLDSVALFRITIPKVYYSRFRTMDATQRGLSDVVDGTVKLVASSQTMEELLATKREEVLRRILAIAREQTKDYGLSIEDVAFKRVSLPKQNEQSVYESMSTERKRIATQLRSEGKAMREEIMSKADRERTRRIADAMRRSEEIRGLGDREAQRVLSEATIGAGGELYSFLKSMEIWKNVLPQATFVIRPGGIFRDLLRFDPAKH